MELISGVPDIETIEPDGAFYVFPVVKDYFGRRDGDTVIDNADELCMYLLNKGHVSSVTGKAFGDPDCIRFSFANSMENIEEGFRRVKEWLGRLR
jgi:aspartate aminotransferase